ncbi:hypothetical protein LTV02_00155 [Nocardia yamanashiensis]|uniref:hypothetical protein n=1 Tax=Nocardia yamanashiensis TaxID=209247 RepID=UPI001E4672F9|nr:hypothetical protein [Nocardia yamanashiensis]UGT41883.1 hypothetical protein LTV02_00155 [Nocardia yamanashiensis]
MIARIAGVTAAAVVALSLGVAGAAVASASEPQAKPVDGSVGVCFTVPMPGSADLVWCL